MQRIEWPHDGRRGRIISLGARIALGVVVFVTLVAASLIQFAAHHEREIILTDRGSQLLELARADNIALRNRIDNLRQDTLFHTDIPPIQGIIRASLNHGFDRVDGNSLETWKKRLQEIFAAQLRSRPEYTKIRYIGVAEGGRELVRVEMRQGRAHVVEPDLPQRREDRAWFRAAIGLRPGEVHFSDVDRETRRAADEPPMYVLRAATPIHGPGGRIFGIVVINMKVDSLLPQVERVHVPFASAFLVNRDGDYLLHSEASRSLGFERGRRRRWQDDMPGLRIQEGNALALQTLSLPAGTLYAVAVRVPIDPLQPERDLILGYTLPATALAVPWAAGSPGLLVLVIAAAALLALALLLGLVRRMFAPLGELTQVALGIAAGNYQTPVPDGARGEVRALAQALRSLQSDVAEREAQYRAIAGTSGDGFWITDMTGHILDVNQSYVNLSGYPREELLAMSIADLEAHEGPEEIQARIERIMRTGSDTFETDHRTKNGTLWATEVRVSYWPQAGGRLFAFMHDISVHKQKEQDLRESEAALEQAQAMAHIGSWRSEIKLRTAVVSAEIMRILDLQKPALTWDELATLLHPDDRQEVRLAWKAMFGSGRYDIEYRVVVAGKTKWLHVTAQFTRDAAGQPLAVVGLLQDVSAIRESELAIESYKNHLEKMVAVRTAALTEANQRIQLILDSSADGIFGMDKAGCFTFANPAACELLGYTPGELLGKPVHALIHHTHPDGRRYLSEECPLNQVLTQGRRYQSDNETFWRSSGESFPIIYAARPIVKNDIVAGAVVNFFDITERRAAEIKLARTQSYLQAILDNMPALIGYWTADLRCAFANHAYLNWFGKYPDELVGVPMQEVLGDELFKANEPHIRGALSGEYQSFERTLVKVDGTTSHMWAQYLPDVVQGVVKGFLVLITDVTELKRTQLEIETLNATLMARTGEAEAANRAKSEFLANMSHEIRTPLNAVLGLAQVSARTNYPPQARDNFRHIHESALHLLNIVNDILDLSKIEAGKLQLDSTRFNLGDVIDRAVSLTAVRAYAKELDFRVSEAAELGSSWRGDPLRLSQILVNLLANAIKFSAKGSITLSVWRVPAGLAFRVSDTGMGMSAADVERLFQPFEQADSSITRRFGGTGLGLTICRRLVDLMGGRIEVESRLGQGSAFTVTLPLAETDGVPATSGGSVVLAGLSETENAILAAELEARGIKVAVCAVADALQAPADLVVLDSRAADDDAAALAAAPASQRPVLISCTPASDQPDLPWSDAYRRIERPLRIRHLLKALASRSDGEPACLPAGPRLTGVRLLAAEDNEVNRLVLEEILVQEGAHLICVEDGLAALERLAEDGCNAYDAVITDIQMPLMDGYELTRHIKKRAPGLPVIALTAHALTDTLQHCTAAGIVEQVTKPVDVDALVNAILRHVSPPAAGRIGPLSSAAASEYGPQAADCGLVDWDGLFSQFNGNKAFVHKLAMTALKSDTAKRATELRDAAARGDFAALAFLAHRLRGMSGNLMAREVHELAKAVEAAARENQQEAVTRAIPLAGLQEALVAELSAHIESSGVGGC